MCSESACRGQHRPGTIHANRTPPYVKRREITSDACEQYLRGDAKVLEEGGRLVVVVAAEQTRELGKRHGRTALPPGVVERANGHRADAPVATDELGHGAGLDVRRRAEQPKEGREVGRTPRHQHLARGGR